MLTLSAIREINRVQRRQDESDEWPICGRFDVAERAIRQARRWRRDYGEVSGVLEYCDLLREMESRIVNNPTTGDRL